MARYGVSTYGTATYGELSPAGFAVQLAARAVSTTAAVLDPGPRPGVTFSNVRVTRNYDGVELDPDTGRVLFNGVYWPGPLMDSTLEAGRWAYYSLFIYVRTEGTWIFAGSARVLVPLDYGGPSTLADRAPFVERSNNLSPTDPADLSGPGSQFMAVFGYASDQMRTQAADLYRIHNLRRCCYSLLPAAMSDLGIAFEPAIGPRQNRRWATAAHWLARRRGTVAAVLGAVRAITGYDAQVAPGANLIWSGDYDGQPQDTSPWMADSGYAVRGRAAVPAALLPDRDEVYFPGGAALGAAATGAVTVTTALPNTTTDNAGITPAVQLGMPVTPGVTYTYGQTFFTLDVNQATVAVHVRWLDAGGVLLSQLTHSDATIPRGVATVSFVTGAAPTGAVYALVGFVSKNERPQQPLQFWGASFGVGQAPVTDPPALQVVTLVATRTNLVTNPSAETDTSGWTGGGAGSASPTLQQTTDAFVGTKAFSATYTSPGAYQRPPMTLSASYAQATITPVVGKTYLFDVTVKVPTGSTTTSLVIAYLAGGATVSELIVPVTAGTYVSARLRFLAAAGTSRVLVGLDADPGASGNAEYRWDAALVEVTSSDVTYGVRPAVNNQDPAAGPVANRRVGQFFSGSSYSTTGEFAWTGTPQSSTSTFHRDRLLRVGRLNQWLPEYLPVGTPFSVVYVAGS